MSRAARFLPLFAAALSAIAWCGPARGGDLAEVFRNPPEEARPWVFWYWMNAAVSRAGITADLEAMRQAGIGGAYLCPIKDAVSPPLLVPPVRQLTPEWWAMVRHAMTEADRLGIRLAMHASDGFATAGGPWITPELSMQQVVWSEIHLTGGQRFDGVLPQPRTNEDYYRDIAVLVFPVPADTGESTRTVVPKVTTSVAGEDAAFLAAEGNTRTFRSAGPCWIQYSFGQPFTCRSVTIRPNGGNNTFQANRLLLAVSDDGEHFRSVAQLEPPRHGWADGEGDTTHAIPATTARCFRFSWDPAGAEAGAEDLDSAKWKPVLKVRGIALSGESRLHEFEGKNGAVWRSGPRTTATQVPDAACVQLSQVVDLTGQLAPDGRLTWDVPAGAWTILRLGHTSTGRHNETAGAGRGLECDKLNPEAVRMQFDHWFGEVIRQIGLELAGRVLKVFHVDSWECGSQNWSAAFRGEFQRRRGYDPLPYLPAMAGIPVQSAEVSERFLRDVRQTITELVVENFYGTMAELARAHGCVLSAESMAPVMTGDSMRLFGAVDIPMGEFWLRSPTHDKPNDIHDAISGAHIYGKPLVQAEAFTELALQWDEHPGMLKALGDHQFALGVNRFVLHVFAHNPWLDRRPGMTLSNIGLFFQRDQTWWRPGRAWIDYLRRCQALLQQGRPVADVAWFSGEELPVRAVLPERRRPALPAGYFADSINRDALLRLAAAQNRRMVLPGGASYAALVLPDTPWMSPEVAAKIESLMEGGVTVFGSQAERSPSLEHYPQCDETVRRIAADGWSRRVKPLTDQALSAALADGVGLQPDLAASAPDGTPAEGIEWTHRQLPDAEVYFVSNQRGTERKIEISLRTAGRWPELWDPVTGEMRRANRWLLKAGRTTLPLRLAPNGSIFIVLREPATGSGSSVGENWSEPRMLQSLDGAWRVSFDPKAGGPSEPLQFEQLESWTKRAEEGVRFYSGTAVYARAFNLSEPAGGKRRIWLDLGCVANLAEVEVNGLPCGVAWTDPGRVEITAALRSGENQLRIAVTNTWANRLTGDRALPEGSRTTWTTAAARPEGSPLLEAGLLGPVMLLGE